MGPMSLVLGAHTGPSMVGVGFGSQAVFDEIPDRTGVEQIIGSLDMQGRWLVTGAKTSNPYKGDGMNQEPTLKYASTNVGDETDTSPYPDTTDQEYISTGQYILNMQLLINYINAVRD